MTNRVKEVFTILFRLGRYKQHSRLRSSALGSSISIRNKLEYDKPLKR